MTAPLRLLLVEDSESDAKLLVQALRAAGYALTYERVETAAAMESALAAGAWDMVISDWVVPGFGGMAALGIVQRTGRDLPFIIVSGTVGEDVAADAMRAGANDYVLKDKLTRLMPAIARELTEHDARAASARERVRFRALIERSSDGMLLVARDGAIEYASPAARTILGLTAETERTVRTGDLTHPDDRAAVQAVAAQLFAQPGRSAQLEFRVVQGDGTVRWIECVFTNRFDEPEVAALVGNLRDVTERRAAADALRISDARYRRIVETTNEGVWILDADARTTFMNERMVQLVGFDPTRAVDDPPFAFLGDEARRIVEKTIPRLRAGEIAQLELPVVRHDGKLVWLLLEASPILDAAGRFESAIGMAMDITERKRVEAALRQSEARFSRLSDSGIIGIAIVDVFGNVHDVNDAYLRLLGYSRDEFLAGAVRWPELTPPEHRDGDDRALALLASEGTAPVWEKELICKDGHRACVLVGIALLEHPLCIAFAADLTDRKRTESVLRKTEDQLRQAQKMEAVGRLAGGVAHDFNNVLSVILSLTDLMLDDLAPGAAMRDDLAEIRKAGWRAAELTRQLLMFSRQQVLAPKPLDLNELLANLDRMLQRLVGEDVELLTTEGHGLGRVLADASSVEQVVVNLVVNARDAMPTGGKLTIETANVMLDDAYAAAHHGVVAGPHVMLAVSDNGTGMDKATQARVFEPFFTTKATGKGTGLGLSTVFGIVQQSNGSVWLYSEPAHGTTFKIYLPRIDAAAVSLRAAPIRELPRGTETVLLVEDEDAVRLVALSILRRQGYVVLEARNGEAALRLAAQHVGAIDLLLTDVVMPHMSGPELAGKLAASRPATRRLLMSGYTDDSAVRHGVLDASFAFIQKPITPDSLARKVREVLDA